MRLSEGQTNAAYPHEISRDLPHDVCEPFSPRPRLARRRLPCQLRHLGAHDVKVLVRHQHFPRAIDCRPRRAISVEKPFQRCPLRRGEAYGLTLLLLLPRGTLLLLLLPEV